MTDKIQKALNKFSNQENEIVKNLLLKIKNKQLLNTDIKKLKGYNDIYRVRKGKIRIIYKINNDEIYLLAIERCAKTTAHSTKPLHKDHR